jgi:hypothetical protein
MNRHPGRCPFELRTYTYAVIGLLSSLHIVSASFSP